MTDSVTPKYEIRKTTTIRGLDTQLIAQQEADGWELIAQNDAPYMRSELTFRRPQPKPWWHVFGPKIVGRVERVAGGTRSKIGAALVLLLILGGLITANAILENGREATALPTARPTSTPISAASPTPTPTPSRTASAAASVTDRDIIEAFEAYIAQREADGVVVARTVTDVSFKNRVLRVTFDPAAGDIDQDTFDVAIGPWNGNLAGFPSSAIAFDDEIGNKLRPEIDRIEAVQSDGTALGTMSAAQILALNGLEK